MVTCPACASENADGARFCSHCGNPLEPPRPVEGERKLATFLFADVVRSTAMAERLDPEDWAAIMNGAFRFMNASVVEFGGTVSRLMGDGVLAFFGAPVSQEDHAERAVRAGIRLVEAAEKYGRTVEERYGVEFRIRVGINTGTSVLAFVGDAVKEEYTSMGDPANVAARLQSAARPGTVLISADTHRLVRGLFDVRGREPLSLEGKTEPAETFEVVAARTVPGRVRGIEGLQAPLVGRDREMGILRERFAALREGRGAAIAIVGEAGLGKSRLVAELRREVDAGGEGDAWYEGRAISYGQALTYHPWQQIGRQMIGVTEADTPAAVREALARFLAAVGVDSAHAPLLETMLAVESAESRAALADVDGDQLVQRIADAVMACVRGGMRQDDAAHPLVLVFDDLHWADSASVELLAQLSTLTLGEPLLLLCLLRPDRAAPSWPLLERLRATLGESAAELAIEPLAADESGALLGQLLHVEELPHSVRATILQKSDGNPFFLEEVLRSLIDSGHVVRENGHWRATREIVDVSIPDTLAGVLGARIDRLPDPTKRVAQTAAVLGRIFPYRALATVCRAASPPDRIDNVDPHLGTLTYEELIRVKARDPEREYIFKHALTQEAAYNLLLRQRRRELHLLAGKALEELFADRSAELAPLLARHFHEGGDAKRAADYAVRAAEHAIRLYALAAAVDHYQLAYDALAEAPESHPEALIDAIVGWVMARFKMTDYAGVLERLIEAETLARSIDDRPRLARVLSWISTIHMVTGFPTRSEPYLVESNELAAELGIESLLLLPFFFATEALIDREPRKAADQFEQIVEIARRRKMSEIEGHALASRATALARLGEFALARTVIDQAIAAAPSGGHRVKEADVHLLVASALYDIGAVDEGLEHARIGAELAHAENALECACAGYYAVGMGELERRELALARSTFEQSLRIGDQAGWEGWSGFMNKIRAASAITDLQDGSEEAVAALETSLANARSDNDLYLMASISMRLAQLHLDRNEPGPAGEFIAAATDFYRESDMKPYLARALQLAASAATMAGRAEDAERARLEADTLNTLLRERMAESSAQAAPARAGG